MFQSLCQRFNVQGFPTILFFGSDKENPSPYEGPRSASGIEEFALDSLAENIPSPEVYELTGPVFATSFLMLDSWLYLQMFHYLCYPHFSTRNFFLFYC